MGATAVADPPSTQRKHGIIRLVNRVRIELMDALDGELAEFDISAAQLIVLASVRQQGSRLRVRAVQEHFVRPRRDDPDDHRLEQKGLVRCVSKR